MRAIHLMGLVMLGTSGPAPAPGGLPHSRPAPARRPAGLVNAAVADTVRGIVFDSITNAPMADAFVVAEPGGAVTATTREGRFILVSPARVRKISVFHDVTERLGLSGLSVVRPDPSQPWTDVMVATPSMSTLWSRHCAGQTPAPGMAGILMGSTRSSRDSTPVAGARVSVQWSATAVDGKKAGRAVSTAVVANERGEFTVCGVQEAGETRIQATSRGARSASVVLPAAPRSIHRIELMLWR